MEAERQTRLSSCRRFTEAHIRLHPLPSQRQGRASGLNMKFGILGYGNLGKAVASALVCSGEVSVSDISVCDISGEALSLAEKEHYRVYPISELNRMIADADVLCLVVKGYVFEELAPSIDKQTLKDKLVISFMAGVTIERLAGLIGNTMQIARAMPSLAIARNEGIIAYTKLPEPVAAIFDRFGYAFEVEPENIEKVTAFSACGLGFAAYLIDAFKSAGENLGFDSDTAAHIAALTFNNACDTGNFRDTVKAVATPGGATEQGINHMEASNVYAIVSDAMQKAYKKMS